MYIIWIYTTAMLARGTCTLGKGAHRSHPNRPEYIIHYMRNLKMWIQVPTTQRLIVKICLSVFAGHSPAFHMSTQSWGAERNAFVKDK